MMFTITNEINIEITGRDAYTLALVGELATRYLKEHRTQIVSVLHSERVSFEHHVTGFDEQEIERVKAFLKQIVEHVVCKQKREE